MQRRRTSTGVAIPAVISEAPVGVGDDELHATPVEAAQELRPKRLGFAVANHHAERGSVANHRMG